MSVMTGLAIVNTIVGISAADKAKKEQEEAARKAEAAADEAERERIRVQEDMRPEGETATGIDFGTSKSKTGDLGSYEDFVVQDTSSSGLNTSGDSGIGFNV